MQRFTGMFMIVVAIAIMMQRQAGVTNFVADLYGIDNGLIALAIGIPFTVCGLLLYTKLGKLYFHWLLLPIVMYAVTAAYLALSGTGNYVPALFYMALYVALIELISRSEGGAGRGH